ncbi:hypothetical protein D5R93_03925 [Actinomyces lilanjuaniae]|uniref:Uncharacterized protein n=1 Tax=Actinomyces lilanjuaniae TaxID=2321394 RepID=A0ABN5PQU1_9ACTO|nr:hypothetical protein D5R93_03925 [Actinomyces lilanjuaniae]
MALIESIVPCHRWLGSLEGWVVSAGLRVSWRGVMVSGMVFSVGVVSWLSARWVRVVEVVGVLSGRATVSGGGWC